MLKEDKEDNIPLHTSSNTNLIRSWTPFTSDPHLPQPIPSQARPEENLDNDSEKADPEGEQEGAPITDIDAPRSVSFEKPPDNFALPTTNQPADPLSQSQAADAATLLRYHYRYGHISFRRLKKMAEQGVLPQHLKNISTPACLACHYAKATKRPWRHKPQKHYTPPPPPTTPGQVVSVDQLVSPTPGLIAQMTGKLTTKRYKYATVFVDHFSRFSYVYLQKTATVEETLEAKKAFETYAASHQVQIQNYHADNGIFRANEWIKHCHSDPHPQGMSFSGVDAHHTNGIAERRIRDIQDAGRTMLIHAAHRWKTHITTNLWPYAIRLGNHAYNSTPLLSNAQGKTPIQLFTSTEVQDNPKHWKPFGCPTFVLTSALRAPQRIHHKWKQRAELGIYLGPSPVHHRNVALILNPTTGLVSPQFHVRFDPEFTTAPDLKNKSSWQYIAGFIQGGTTPNRADRYKMRTQNTQELSLHQKPITSVLDMASLQPKGGEVNTNTLPPPYQGLPPPSQSSEANQEDIAQPEGGIEQQTKRAMLDDNASTFSPRRSKRVTKPVDRLMMAMETVFDTMVKENQTRTRTEVKGEIFCYQAMFPADCSDNNDNLSHLNPLMAYKATSDPDSMYLHEAMQQEDKAEFLKAMLEEVRDQTNNENFSIIKRNQVPRGSTILPCVWQMKRKRHIKTRKIKRWKARLTVDGSRMTKGVHYDKVYAPVASWTSIRLLLTMIVLHNWNTTQIDYVQAFPQAPAEKDLYLKVPSLMSLHIVMMRITTTSSSR